MNKLAMTKQILLGKGYKILELNGGKAIDTNQAESPIITIRAFHKYVTWMNTPEYWRGKNASQQVIDGTTFVDWTFDCKLRFSKDHPMDVEAITKILEKRIDSLYKWALELPAGGPTGSMGGGRIKDIKGEANPTKWKLDRKRSQKP